MDRTMALVAASVAGAPLGPAIAVRAFWEFPRSAGAAPAGPKGLSAEKPSRELRLRMGPEAVKTCLPEFKISCLSHRAAPPASTSSIFAGRPTWQLTHGTRPAPALAWID